MPRPDIRTPDLRAGDLVAALTLLTRIPAPARTAHDGARVAASVWAFPVIGAGVGLVGGLVFAFLGSLGTPGLAAAALAIAAMMIVTGGLHEDGLADTADGLGGGWTPERRLEIMKDSRIGSYGAAALGLALLARAGCVAGMPPREAIAALIAAEAVSRCWLGLAMRLPPARSGGMSAGAGVPPAANAWVAAGLGAVIALAMGAPMALPAALLGYAAIRVIQPMIGGQTGDTLGAGQQVAVIAALIAA